MSSPGLRGLVGFVVLIICRKTHCLKDALGCVDEAPSRSETTIRCGGGGRGGGGLVVIPLPEVGVVEEQHLDGGSWLPSPVWVGCRVWCEDVWGVRAGGRSRKPSTPVASSNCCARIWPRLAPLLPSLPSLLNTKLSIHSTMTRISHSFITHTPTGGDQSGFWSQQPHQQGSTRARLLHSCNSPASLHSLALCLWPCD